MRNWNPGYTKIDRGDEPYVQITIKSYEELKLDGLVKAGVIENVQITIKSYEELKLLYLYLN